MACPPIWCAAVCERVMVTDEPHDAHVRGLLPRRVPAARLDARPPGAAIVRRRRISPRTPWFKPNGGGPDVAALDNPAAGVRRVALNRSSNEGRRRRRESAALLRPQPPPRSGRCRRASRSPMRNCGSASHRCRGPNGTAVVLRYVDDLPLADIALVIGCRRGHRQDPPATSPRGARCPTRHGRSLRDPRRPTRDDWPCPPRTRDERRRHRPCAATGGRVHSAARARRGRDA